MLQHLFNRQLFPLFFFLFLSLAACTGNIKDPPPNTGNEETDPVTPASQAMGRGMGNMGGGSMMARHHATIPAAYAEFINPVPASAESIARGADHYATYCITCHGQGGMGDGPGANGLDPAPAPIAHTSQMMGDNYLFWRISEGGAMEPFNSVMPPWKGSLDEEARWDVINYVRALGQGTVQPATGAGGAAFDPAAEAAKHEEMVRKGVEMGLFTAAEGDTFLRVHAELDNLVAAGFAAGSQGGMAEMQEALLETLITEKTINAADAAVFAKVHDKLAAAGLME